MGPQKPAPYVFEFPSIRFAFTPKQVALYEALGWPVPEFAHLSTILGSDRERLSKRHGATSIANFRDMGVLPEALVNYLALLGWAPPGGTREIFSPPELIKEFSLQRVTPSPAVFDMEKLYWLNRHYIKECPSDVLLRIGTWFLIKSKLLDGEKAKRLRGRLMANDMFSGWGIRTLGSQCPSFNPVGYHVGSIWPHDNALIASGLMRYGFVDEAQRVIMGLLDAAVHQGARLPELFSGLSRRDVPFPVSYPSSCSPQAWAAASPLLCLRTLLRFDPWVPHGKVWCSPVLPERFPARTRVGR